MHGMADYRDLLTLSPTVSSSFVRRALLCFANIKTMQS